MKALQDFVLVMFYGTIYLFGLGIGLYLSLVSIGGLITGEWWQGLAWYRLIPATLLWWLLVVALTVTQDSYAEEKWSE